MGDSTSRRIVFFMRTPGYVRNFEWVIRRLLDRGHTLEVVIDHPKMKTSERAALDHLEGMCRELPNLRFRYLIAPDPRVRLISGAKHFLRLSQDYLRYFDPAFEGADRLRERAGRLAGRWTQRILRLIGVRPVFRRKTQRLLAFVDGLIPAARDVRRFLQHASPDVVLVTPLVSHGSYQVEYFRAATELGLRSVLMVASWDNLTSKGLLHCEPGWTLVWNAAQKQEAVELLGLPASRVITTGAHPYDHWFTMQPSTSRQEFLHRLGLPPDRLYILYLCSSSFIAPNEVPVVRAWLRAIRRSNTAGLRECGILIRPHPQNAGAWAEADVSDFGPVVVHPRLGSNPIGVERKSDYFDAMYHCALVVGVNTSGLIEAGILGKPVHTVLFDATQGTQEGTLHFRHLSAPETGLLHVSRTLDDHVARLSAALASPADDATRSGAFVESFVRPSTLEKVPADVCVDALEAIASDLPPGPQTATLGTRCLRALASPLLLLGALRPNYWLLRLLAAERNAVGRALLAPARRLRRLLRRRAVRP